MAQQDKQLDGLSVAILVSDLFEQAELEEPKRALEAAGARTAIISNKGPMVHGMHHDRRGDAFKVVPSSSTLSVFDTLDKAVTDLSTPNKRGTQITQDSIMNLRNLDQVMGRLTTARSDAGVTLNRIDGVTDRLGEQKISAETEKSNAEDLDMVQAISDFQNKQSGYDAALKSYSMVQRLSLFQYLNG